MEERPKHNRNDTLDYHLDIIMHTYIQTYIHACMHACMHAYIHTYIHTYIATLVLETASLASPNLPRDKRNMSEIVN